MAKVTWPRERSGFEFLECFFCKFAHVDFRWLYPLASYTGEIKKVDNKLPHFPRTALNNIQLVLAILIKFISVIYNQDL